MIDRANACPLHLVCWRRSEETLCTHRCPLWDIDIGITPSKTIAIDLMHTLHLGVMQEYAKEAVWLLLLSPVWGIRADLNQDVIIEDILLL